MQKIIRLGLFSIAFTFAFSIFAVSDVNAQGPLTEILNRMEKHRNSLSSLKADVKMAKTDALLKETDITFGTVIYLPVENRDDYVRINWSKPVEESMAVVNGKYIIYRPRLKQAICGETEKVQKDNSRVSGPLGFLGMSKAQLKATYNRQYLGVTKINGSEVAHIKLSPKKKNRYKSAEVWVDADGMPVQAKVVEDNDDSTTIQLSKISKNVKVNGSDFKINLPKGVKCTKG